MADWMTQLKKGMLEYGILILLSHGESYGYQIVNALQGLKSMEAKESTVYPILRRLRQDGCLAVRLEESTGGPPRRYFRLNDQGHERLSEMNASWQSLCLSIQTLQQGPLADDP